MRNIDEIVNAKVCECDVDMPYFMTNEEWYEFNPYAEDDERTYTLTSKAPAKAVKSYKDYYKMFDNEITMENGEPMITNY